MKKNGFVEGTIISTLAIIFTKVLGIIYVIPFYALIGTMGSSLYSYAYNIYATFLNISSAGVPIAISKIVSEYNSKNLKEAKVRTYKLGIIIVSVLSIVCFLGLFIFTKPIVLLIIGNKMGGNSIEDIILVIRAISFSILIIPFLSVSKGYLQGHRYIYPTSMSQMIEQIVRIIFVLLGSFFVIKIMNMSIPFGVATALIGAFIGGLVALLYILKKIFNNKKELDLEKNLEKDTINNKEILKKILKYAIPFIIINVTVNLYNLVDMTLVIRTLGKIGFSGENAEFVASAMTTWGYKLNRIVNAIATGLTISLIPNIVEANTLGNKIRVNKIFNRALQIVLFVSLPTAFGLSFLAAPVWTLFYDSSSLGPIVFQMSILTAIMSNLYLVSMQTTQSLNEYKTVYKAIIFGFAINALLDAPLMYVCNYIGIPAFYGANIASIFGYVISLTIIFRKLIRYKDFSIRETIVILGKLVLAVIIMICSLVIIRLLIPFNSISRIDALLYIILFAAIGGVIYFFLTYKMGLIDSIIGKEMISKIIKKITFGKICLGGDTNANKNN